MGSTILKIKHKNDKKSCQTKAKKGKSLTKDKDGKNVDAKKRAKTAPNRKSVPGAYRSNIFTGEKGPGGGELQGPMHPKVVQNCHF